MGLICPKGVAPKKGLSIRVIGSSWEKSLVGYLCPQAFTKERPYMHPEEQELKTIEWMRKWTWLVRALNKSYDTAARLKSGFFPLDRKAKEKKEIENWFKKRNIEHKPIHHEPPNRTPT